MDRYALVSKAEPTTQMPRNQADIARGMPTPLSPSATAAKESDGLQPQAFMQPSLRQRECG
jgi:hypothetical protein